MESIYPEMTAFELADAFLNVDKNWQSEWARTTMRQLLVVSLARRVVAELAENSLWSKGGES